MNGENTGSSKKIITHSGNFHADEVFACATLSIIFGDNVEIVRSRNPELWEGADIVVDVGGIYNEDSNRFDHHQEGGAGARENGIPYASFGLVWKRYGEALAGSAHAARAIDERLVQFIDAGDNGVETYTKHEEVSPYLINDVIASFRPAWNEERTIDEGFFEALLFAKKILEREIIFMRAEEEGTARVLEAYDRAEDKRIIILDKHYPWYRALGDLPEPLYVVKPDRDNGNKWKIEAVRDDTHSFKNRKDLPSAWAGKRDEALAHISGVSDAIFCHNKRFIAVAGSQDGAIKLAKLAVEA